MPLQFTGSKFTDLVCKEKFVHLTSPPVKIVLDML